MNIVLIEDDDQKAERVKSSLEVIAPSAKISLFRSYQSGLRFLESSDGISLVVLDVSLPTFDPSPNIRHGRPRPLGGYDLMRKLKRIGKMPPVVILTALENFGTPQQQFSFDQLAQKCKEEFSERFLGAIYYSQSKTDWRNELNDIIQGLK
ncbi:MAG: response regulator [Pseudomonadota bacterium]